MRLVSETLKTARLCASERFISFFPHFPEPCIWSEGSRRSENEQPLQRWKNCQQKGIVAKHGTAVLPPRVSLCTSSHPSSTRATYYCLYPVHGQMKFVYGRHGHPQERILVGDVVVHLHDAQRMHARQKEPRKAPRGWMRGGGGGVGVKSTSLGNARSGKIYCRLAKRGKQEYRQI